MPAGWERYDAFGNGCTEPSPEVPFGTVVSRSRRKCIRQLRQAAPPPSEDTLTSLSHV